MRARSVTAIALLATMHGMTGCSTIHTQTPEGKVIAMDQKGFADYVEQVFRHHNAVVDQLLYTEDASTDRNRSLAQAEAKMTLACLPINEVVSASAIGQNSGYWAHMHLPDAVPKCEAATREVEALISPNH